MNKSRTPSGTEVYLQLLGDNPELMAANAKKAVKLGATGIDINFGCPAKTVNKSGGGSVLLQYPETLYQVTHAIREALAPNIPVTAKVRLGYRDNSLALEIGQAIEAAGASEICIHGRTKVQGYKPPAYWDDIGRVNQALSIPVIANGEIWNTQDAKRCMAESGCTGIMLGRGLVACPDLALFIQGSTEQALNWQDILCLLEYYYYLLQGRCPEKYQNNLIKQWLLYLRMHYGEAYLFFEKVKTLRQSEQMLEAIMSAQTRRQKPEKIGKLVLNTACLRSACLKSA
jgi:tRNA-dihydrouridine synthase C